MLKFAAAAAKATKRRLELEKETPMRHLRHSSFCILHCAFCIENRLPVDSQRIALDDAGVVPEREEVEVAVEERGRFAEHLHQLIVRMADRLDMDLDDGYVGNEWDELITVYQLHYWSEDECGGKFLDFLDEVEELRIFIQDYLLAVGEELRFDITQDEKPLRLGDELFYNYLGYNTNI